RSVMGRIKTALAPAGAGRRIHAPLDVRLAFGALASREDEDFFAGAGAFAVKTDAGWELCQFQNAELLENGDWRLTGLLRGQAGTEQQALAGASIDARFVLLNNAVTQIEFASVSRNIAFDWQAGPDGALAGSENFTSESLTMSARGLMPLAPVHLRARRDGDELHLSWIRRTRQGGDSWEGEVPIGEQSERYRLTIYDGATPVREVETASPEYAYDAADIAADFGGPYAGGAISFAVAQISDAVGEGVEAKRDVEIA
ncbi:phage tail baseplate protein, partial [Hyphococcus sp.]|uniref:GTA baseplate fiber-binding domain-containing protein n=1 Tax=Hyphococcus sp. TaxID=2038636 RepID=UPI003D80A4AC